MIGLLLREALDRLCVRLNMYLVVKTFLLFPSPFADAFNLFIFGRSYCLLHTVNMIGCWQLGIILSSVRLSVVLCIVALRVGVGG